MSSLAEAIFLNKPRGEKEENTWENEEEIFCALLAFFSLRMPRMSSKKTFLILFLKKTQKRLRHLDI